MGGGVPHGNGDRRRRGLRRRRTAGQKAQGNREQAEAQSDQEAFGNLLHGVLLDKANVWAESTHGTDDAGPTAARARTEPSKAELCQALLILLKCNPGKNWLTPTERMFSELGKSL